MDVNKNPSLFRETGGDKLCVMTWKAGSTVAYSHSPGVRTVPYRVIDTRGKYSITD
jgi:hypothetical protein